MNEPLTTERIRDLYTIATAWHSENPRTKHVRASNRAQFDSWIKARDAKVKAEVLRDAAVVFDADRLRWVAVEGADRIEKGSTDE